MPKPPKSHHTHQHSQSNNADKGNKRGKFENPSAAVNPIVQLPPAQQLTTTVNAPHTQHSQPQQHYPRQPQNQGKNKRKTPPPTTTVSDSDSASSPINPPQLPSKNSQNSIKQRKQSTQQPKQSQSESKHISSDSSGDDFDGYAVATTTTTTTTFKQDLSALPFDQILNFIKSDISTPKRSPLPLISDDSDGSTDDDRDDMLDSADEFDSSEGEMDFDQFGAEGELDGIGEDGYEGEIEFDEEFLLSLINGSDSDDDDDDDDDDDYSPTSRSQSDLSKLSFQDLMKVIQSDVKSGQFLDINPDGTDSTSSSTHSTSSSTEESTIDTNPGVGGNPDTAEQKRRAEAYSFAKMQSPFAVSVKRSPEIHLSRLQLPVCAQEHEIMELINANDVTILSGETGSGKTTQVPQFLYETGYCRDGIIGITQPRRVAAISAANRVKMELNTNDSTVGFQIRFESNCTSQTRIKMMTEGVLLREIQTDFLLSRYSCIIIDEAHERGLNTDILLGLLSRIIPLRNKIVEICRQLGNLGLLTTSDDEMSDSDLPFYNKLSLANQRFFDGMFDSIIGASSSTPKSDSHNLTISEQPKSILGLDENHSIMGFDIKRLKLLPYDQLAKQFALTGISKGKLKLIIMSATLRVTDFTQNYKLFPLPPPVYTVNSRQYPVSTHFSRLTPTDYVEKCLQKVCRIHTRLPPGAILVFLTGREEIESFCSKLRDIFPPPVPGQDNSGGFQNGGLGVSRLYIKATKMVKKALFDYNIAVDFGEEDKGKLPDISHSKNQQPETKRAGAAPSHPSTTFAKPQSDVLSRAQQRWNLLNWDDDDDAKKVDESKLAKQLQPEKTKQPPPTPGRLLGPQGKPPSDTITPKMLKFLVQKQVVILKQTQEEKRHYNLQGRNKVEKSQAFSMEEIEQDESAVVPQESETAEDFSIEVVNVIAELVKFRAAQIQKAKQTKQAKLEGNSSTNNEDSEIEEGDEILYELSDNDDYDDDGDGDGDEELDGIDKPKKTSEFGSDVEEDVKSSAPGGSGDNIDDVEDSSLTILQKEQNQSPATKAKQQQRWEDELSQLKSNSPIPLLVLPLYAMLPTPDQMKVFHWEKYSHGARVVIVSTNMAETSVTIPNIKYVVDSGREKAKNVDVQTGATNFSIGFIPQSSAGQRAGRAGRTGPGHAYRIFSGAVFTDYFPLHSTPEILKQPFESTLLQMKSIGIHDITRFPFPTPPLYKTVKSSGYLLYVLGALQTKQEKLHKLRQTEALGLLKDNTSHLNTSLKQSMQSNLLSSHNFQQQNRVNDSTGSFHLQAQSKWEQFQQFQKLQALSTADKSNSTTTPSFSTMTAGMTKFQKKQYVKQRNEEEEQKKQFQQQKALIDDAILTIEQVRVPTAGGTQYSTLVDMDITTLGETMAFFPLHPRFSKIILTCANQPLGVLSYGIALTAVMTIQEIHTVPGFVREYEVAQKKAKAAKKVKSGGTTSRHTTKGGLNKDDSDHDDESEIDDSEDVDLTTMDSDDEDQEIKNINKSLADIEEKQFQRTTCKLVQEIGDEMSKLMAEKQQRKYEKLLKLKLEKIQQKKAQKKWVQEQYAAYRQTVGQFVVDNSDLFTKLNIFGAYLFSRLSFIKQSWLGHKKALYQQLQADLKASKITQTQYEEQCYKNSIPIPQLNNLQPSIISSKFGHVKKLPEIYETLPPKVRIQVDKKLEGWCRAHFVRPKGLADCYKLFNQILRIVSNHLQSKIKQLQREGQVSSKSGKLLDTEADGELNLEDVTLGDQNDEEYDKAGAQPTTNSFHKSDPPPTKLSAISHAKVSRMQLLLDNLNLFSQSMPPPDASTYSLLQQIILASFADKLAWKMTDERKQEYIQRSILQRSHPSSTQALLTEPIKLIPRPIHYSEHIRQTLHNLKHRFGLVNQQKTTKLAILSTGISDSGKSILAEAKQKELPPEYIKQHDEFVKTIPLSMNDLSNAYEILDSDEPVFISPQSILYQKQGGWLNKMKEARLDGTANEIIIDDTNETTRAQSLQALAQQRKAKSSTLASLQNDMDCELRFIIFNELVENQGKYALSFINDCTLITEAWLPTICDQLCHINSYTAHPNPYFNDPTNPPHDSQPSITKPTSSKSALINPAIPSQLMRYAEITYGHKRWALQPYPVPYLPTVISTLQQGSMGNNATKYEDLTPGTGTINQYFQWFAKFLLDGTIFPLHVKQFVTSYAHSPAMCLDEGKLRDPASSFVNCLVHHQVYTVEDLYKQWWYITPLPSTQDDGRADQVTIRLKNAKFLLQEFNMFLTNKQDRIQFAANWPPKPPNAQ